MTAIEALGWVLGVYRARYLVVLVKACTLVRKQGNGVWIVAVAGDVKAVTLVVILDI
jgi:hypothetical protein